MKNLNRTIEKASMPKLSPVKSVNRKFLYSLCTALFLLTCSLSTKAVNIHSLYSYGYGFYYGSGTGPSDLFILPYTLGFSSPNSTYFQNSQCTSCSPLTNNYGDSIHSGSDKWIQVDLADNGYLTIRGGTSDFDSVFYLFDSSWNLITSADDGYGSSWGTHGPLQPQIQYYANAGTYYLIVDGTDKFGAPVKGTVNVDFVLTH